MVAKTHTLFITHKSISKVAKIREVNIETIERQLIILIVKGLLSVNECVKEKIKEEVYTILKETNPITLSEIKDRVSLEVSWFEIKACIASLGIEA